jgi:flavin reductase (NADH)
MRANAPSVEDGGALAAAMRAGMRRMSQCVCVISAVDARGARHAMTASSVTSVSADPPSLLVCVHRDAAMHPVLAASRPFCVNVLSSNMQDISQRCADLEQREERFTVGNWRSDAGPDAPPYLADAEAVFFCTPSAALQYGTHLICVASITDVRVRDGSASPLIYLGGRYLQP